MRSDENNANENMNVTKTTTSEPNRAEHPLYELTDFLYKSTGEIKRVLDEARVRMFGSTVGMKVEDGEKMRDGIDTTKWPHDAHDAKNQLPDRIAELNKGAVNSRTIEVKALPDTEVAYCGEKHARDMEQWREAEAREEERLRRLTKRSLEQYYKTRTNNQKEIQMAGETTMGMGSQAATKPLSPSIFTCAKDTTLHVFKLVNGAIYHARCFANGVSAFTQAAMFAEVRVNVEPDAGGSGGGSGITTTVRFIDIVGVNIVGDMPCVTAVDARQNVWAGTVRDGLSPVF